jgi:hypothetical protein
VAVTRLPALCLALACLAPPTLTAQGLGRVWVEPNLPYDGQFTFVRLRYTNFGPSGWAFDYPAMERNFTTILRALSTVEPARRGSNVHTLDDPALFDYTIAYLSEPGYWSPSDAEAAGLRRWLERGGFLIVDDFLFEQWENFERAMRQVLPFGRLVRLDLRHPIFDAFFRIGTLEGLHHPGTPSARAEYYGIYENNDPAARLMVIVNYNNDIGDYMEWSGQGWYPVNLSNDAYKLMTNYIVYGLTR